MNLIYAESPAGSYEYACVVSKFTSSLFKATKDFAFAERFLIKRNIVTKWVLVQLP